MKHIPKMKKILIALTLLATTTAAIAERIDVQGNVALIRVHNEALLGPYLWFTIGVAVPGCPSADGTANGPAQLGLRADAAGINRFLATLLMAKQANSKVRVSVETDPAQFIGGGCMVRFIDLL